MTKQARTHGRIFEKKDILLYCCRIATKKKIHAVFFFVAN